MLINKVKENNKKIKKDKEITVKKLGYPITYGDELSEEEALARLKNIGAGMAYTFTFYLALTMSAKVANAIAPSSGTGGGDIPSDASVPPSSGEVPSGTEVPPSGGEIPPGAPVSPSGGEIPPGAPVSPSGGEVPPGAPVSPPTGDVPGGNPVPPPWWYCPPRRPLTRVEKIRLAISKKMGNSGEYWLGACLALFIIYTFIKPEEP